jgi:hypothetical protein
MKKATIPWNLKESNPDYSGIEAVAYTDTATSIKSKPIVLLSTDV